ncbi:hypothetical protein LXM94_22020 [Rhizobium sp. TRM95111]|uniref:hypothetical protein n=1 Tax=Rhizobium alarense TaxID=2846851 RepID=UPI001F3E98F8|nr:hypothetical protein [Rhizobium alarense]MCF3642652.1 hypothetical protein [Rhizobium alarense]
MITPARWRTQLDRHERIADLAGEQLARILARAELSAGEAEHLCRIMEHGAQAFDTFVDTMRTATAKKPLVEHAERLQDRWADLVIEAANRLATLEGLPPIVVGQTPTGTVAAPARKKRSGNRTG